MESYAVSDGFSSEDLYRMLPSVNDLLQMEVTQPLLRRRSRAVVVNAIRSTLDRLREEIAGGIHTPSTMKERLEAFPTILEDDLS